MTDQPTTDAWVPPEVDLNRPSPSRIYDYWLGGRDNRTEDRRVAERVADVAPWVVAGVRANRAFLKRSVTYLAEQGIEQFIDLGSGLPTQENVHEVAAKINDRTRVVYVDNDPVVLAHGRALLADRKHAIVLSGDVRDPNSVLSDRRLHDHLDMSLPVAVLFVAILHFIADEEDPGRIVRTFRDAMAPDSYLVLSHVADVVDAQRTYATRAAAEIYSETVTPFTVRSVDEIERLFSGFDLVSPGLVHADHWMHEGKGEPAPVLSGLGKLRG